MKKKDVFGITGDMLSDLYEYNILTYKEFVRADTRRLKLSSEGRL